MSENTSTSEQLRRTTKEEQFVEEALLEHTASQKWEQIKHLDWTSAEVIDVIGKALANDREEAWREKSDLMRRVSVRDLKELIEMWKESSKIPAMVGESKEAIAAKNIVYAECCRELKRLIDGDKSVIEKI